MDASRNHGKCSNGTNNSRLSMNSQKPWTETFVTSAGKMFRPSATDVIDMLLNQPLGLGDLSRLETVVGKQLDHGFNPELGLAVCVLDVHVGSGFLARK